MIKKKLPKKLLPLKPKEKQVKTRLLIILMKKIKSQLPIVIWFTGLSGSGKTTIANKIYQILIQKGYKTELIDGDKFRDKNTDFSKNGIIINNRNIITLCEKLLHTNDFIIVSVISPFNSTRNEARAKLEKKYIEVYIKVSLKTVIKRDTKGYYKKALSGKIDHFIGIDPITPYEKPTNPEIIINTDSEEIAENAKYNYDVTIHMRPDYLLTINSNEASSPEASHSYRVFI